MIVREARRSLKEIAVENFIGFLERTSGRRTRWSSGCGIYLAAAGLTFPHGLPAVEKVAQDVNAGVAARVPPFVSRLSRPYREFNSERSQTWQ